MAAPLPESDGDLVRLALEGRQDAFSALYERYFPSVFDFVTRLLRNREEAADVAQDAFIKAMEQLPTLKNPDRFKSWIFTIAHRTGLNRIRSSKRTATVGGSVDDDERATMAVADADPSVDPEQMAAIQEAADIIWEAAAGLDARTYAVMDLHVRHGLDSAEIAEVMGVSKGNAYTMVSRMKQSFSKTLSTYLLVRKGRSDCPKLASVIGPEVDQMTPDLRKRADRHVNRCEVCSGNRLFYMEPLKMFAALMLVPVPAGLKAAIWGSVAASAAGAAGIGTVASSAAASGAAAGTGAGGSGAGVAAGGVAAGAQAGTIAAAVAAVTLTVALAAGTFALLTRSETPPAAAPSPTTTTTLVTEAVAAAAQASPGTASTSAPAPSATTTSLPPTPTTLPPTPTTLPPTSSATLPSPAPPTLPPAFVVTDDSGTVAEDTTMTVNVLANDIGQIDPSSLRIVSGPGNGSAATSAAGAILYTPARDFVGSDQVSYSVADTSGRSGSATLRVTVTPINDRPVVPGPGAIAMAEDGTLSFDPLEGASDVDGDELVMTSFDATSSAGGTLSEGSLVYVPPANFFGTDSFSYVVSDGTASIVVQVEVTVDPVADPPAAPAKPPVMEVPEDGSATFDLLAGWTDPDGDALTVVPGTISSSNGALVVIDASGTATYTPPVDFNGDDTFEFVVTDGTLETAATAAVTVTSANDAPVAEAATFSVAENAAAGTVVGTIVASDPDGDALTFAPVSGPIAIDANGAVAVGEALDFETAAVHTATTTVADGNGGETDVTVTLNVTNVNESPVAEDVTFEVPEDAVVGTVLGTIVATDPDGDSVSFSSVAGPIAIDAAGEVIVGEPLDFAAQPVHTATTTVSDGNGGETDVTVTLNVLQANRPPSIADGLVVVPDNATPGTVIATLVGTDPDGDELTYAITRGDPEGVFTIGATSGQLVYANDPVALPLPAAIAVTVSDPDGLTDSATITIIVLDATEPTLSGLRSDQTSIMAGTSPALVCPVGQSVAVLSVTAVDEGGLSGVEFGYTGVIAGTIFSGTLPATGAGPTYTADFALFVPADVGRWTQSDFAITATATDATGNVSSLGGATVTVRRCPDTL